MEQKLVKSLQNPGSEFRGKPFWAWNGKLTPAELQRQIRLMKAMGLGGFFMHSRVGLDTEYLSKDWFDNVDACVAEAEKQDMEAWLYDEDRWPSGAAGGLVTKNRAFAMRYLAVCNHDTLKDFSWTPDTMAAFHVVITDTTAKIISRLEKSKKPKALASGETVLAFVKKVEEGSDWYNGETYLDTMNPEAVDAFIKSTHELYKKKYGKEFGKRVPGIFADEPHYGNQETPKNFTLNWTEKLPAYFKKTYGYDLLDHLVGLVYDLDDQSHFKPRYNYRDCITTLFVNAFGKRIYDWCDKNNLQFTGHVLLEDTPSRQTKVVGSAMRFYEYMQAPGMDLLTERWRAYDTAKQVSSMAHQFGAKWRLTETYGCTGWDFSFAGHKALSDWQAALGINVRCQHLSWYTMQGEAKRDYPASIFYQSPWWASYRVVEDYFARIHAAMTQGEEVRDILFIHPIESTWLLFRTGWRTDSAVKAHDQQLVKTGDTLLTAHLDYDYGEEEVMSRHAKVIKTKQGPRLIINKAQYTTVLVPQVLTLRKTTLNILKKFIAVGGKVVFAGEIAKRVDAEPSDEVVKLSELAIRTEREGPTLAAALESTRRVSIQDDHGKEIAPALYLLREDKNRFYLFINNTSLSAAQMNLDVTDQVRVCDRQEQFPSVTVKGFKGCSGKPLELNPETGELFSADAKLTSEGWSIKTSLPVLGTRIFIVPKEVEKEHYPANKQFQTVQTQPLSQKEWPVQFSECNNLVLDRPAYRIGKTDYEPDEILRIDGKVRTALGLAPRGGSMKQPWARKKVPNPKSVPVELVYSFQVETKPDGDLALALELPEKFSISVNGHPVSTDMASGWWVDASLKKVPFDPQFLRMGENKITLTINYEETFSGLEMVYLLGRFGTRIKDGSLFVTLPVTSLKIGDWTEQGLSFYSGSVAYSTGIKKPTSSERVFVAIPDYRGIAVRLLVNGIEAKTLAWEPYEADITDFLRDGDNTLAIEVLGHRRNSHGPHHHKEKWPVWTGPGEYQSKTAWFDDYNLVPCGLMKEPLIMLKKPC